MLSYYLLLKLIHFIAFISWMVGMFYLPRLFVYHSESIINSDKYQTFCVMERRLLKVIMNPAMIITWILGFILIIANDIKFEMWLLLKILLVLIMSGLHGFFSVCQKSFTNNSNRYSSKFYRIINEVPTVLLLLILYMVIFKPSL